MSKWYVWGGFISGLAMSALALWILAEDPSESPLGLPLMLLFGLAAAFMAMSLNRRPLLWIGTEEIAFPREGVLRWDDIEGLVADTMGGYSSLVLVPKDPLLRARLNPFKELMRRFTSWSIGHPVWHGFSLTVIRKQDLDYIDEIIMSKEIPILVPKRWWRRIFGIFGP